MTTTITVPVSGVDNITCHGGAVLAPASVRIRYDRRQLPHVTVTGPTRTAGSRPETRTFDVGACTCRAWLTELVEAHRPAGCRRWKHAEPDVWRLTVGLWINTDDAPDPHRDWTGAVKHALADAGDCVVLRDALTLALTTA